MFNTAHFRQFIITHIYGVSVCTLMSGRLYRKVFDICMTFLCVLSSLLQLFPRNKLHVASRYWFKLCWLYCLILA